MSIEMLETINDEAEVDLTAMASLLVKELTLILSQDTLEFDPGLVEGLVVGKVSDRPPNNLRQYKLLKNKTVSEIGKAGVDIKCFRQPITNSEAIEKLKDFRRERKLLFPGLVSGVNTYDLTQFAATRGLLSYDKEDFAQIIESQIEKDPDELKLAIEVALEIESEVDKRGEVFFPKTGEGYAEFVRGVMQRKINFVGTSCPDYLENYTLGSGVSEQSHIYLDNVPNLVRVLKEYEIEVSGDLLIANTEDDMPDILNRLTDGNRDEFFSRCSQSVERINAEINNLGLGEEIRSGLLLDVVSDFRERQYEEEGKIRIEMERGVNQDDFILATSIERREKYEEILGRKERDHELTVRYLAQYLALEGYLRDMIRRTGEVYLLINYQTPNLLGLNRSDDVCVPVFVVGERG